MADPKSEALFALHRFGFGPQAGAAAISADPRGALLADLERPGAALLTASLPSSGEAARAALQAQEARRAARLAREGARTANSSATAPDASATPNPRTVVIRIWPAPASAVIRSVRAVPHRSARPTTANASQ